jgi:hypothetical protein
MESNNNSNLSALNAKYTAIKSHIKAFKHNKCQLIRQLLSVENIESFLDKFKNKSSREQNVSNSCCVNSSSKIIKAYTSEFAQREARFGTFGARLLSFTHTDEAMADAGFFNNRTNGIIKCFFCNVIIEDWDLNANPIEDHAGISPECQFLRELVSVEYIESVIEKLKNRRMRSNNCSINILFISNKAYTPEFAQYEARLKTFQDWCGSFFHTRERMAEAGYFYNCTNDIVKCFFCNVILDKWDYIHSPINDHVHFSPDCPFIRQLVSVEHRYLYRYLSVKPPTTAFDECGHGWLPPANCPDDFRSHDLNQVITNKPVASLSSAKGEDFPTNTFKTALENKPYLILLKECERLKNERLCVVCLTNDKNMIFLPCAHIAACFECSVSLNSCPICRDEVCSKIRAFS